MSDQSRRIRSGTMVDEIYSVLREGIIDGTFAPGQRLSQEQLAGELQVSRTPLREAFQRLERDGLLNISTNRGMHVSSLNDSETEEHYALRLLVEPPTLKALLNQISDAEIAEMFEALAEMERVTERTRDFQAAHARFHYIALGLYPTAISELIQSLHTKIYRHQRVYLSRPRNPEEFLGADRLLLDQIVQRDGAMVHQLLEFHLIDAALGLLLELNPDHTFGPLLLALRGAGIELEADGEGRVQRPVKLRWRRKDASSMPALATYNVQYEPAEADG
ncbi:MAG: GntR family transcriptional regulator [Acidimicrobiales bacterium]